MLLLGYKVTAQYWIEILLDVSKPLLKKYRKPSKNYSLSDMAANQKEYKLILVYICIFYSKILKKNCWQNSLKI